MGSYGCGIGIGVGIVGGRVGGWGIEGGPDRIVRNGSMDGLAVSVVLRSFSLGVAEDYSSNLFLCIKYTN